MRTGCALLVAFAGLCLCSPASASALTALDRYVAKPDTNYNYKLVKTIPGRGQTTFVLEMTSQAWLTTNEVKQPLWEHWLMIVKPDKVTSSKALLFISGGSIHRSPPSSANGMSVRTALATRSMVAELRGVPNQPIVFADETKGRSEDALIAYTWNKFLRTGDEKWPARLPMTKSAVRAMDTTTAFCASAEAGELKIDSFVVTGTSKRGWTTWTTAAVDKRVVAIVPIVIDALNLEPSFKHHHAAYGFWSSALNDYTAPKLLDWMGTKEYRALMEIEDPYEYRDRLTMPKFIINASGDQYFLPDSSQFYFDDLPGTKYLRYIPNADHSLRGTDALESLIACYDAVLTGARLPQFSWKLEKDGSIRVTAKDSPREVKLWQATNPKARDFRRATIGRAWQSTPVKAEAAGVYIGRIETPAKGWTAFFLELTYPGSEPRGVSPHFFRPDTLEKNAGLTPTPATFKFTTPVRVLPDMLPFKGMGR